MRLFRKRRNPDRYRVAGQLELVLLQKQRQFAGYLDRKTLYWNRSSKVLLLLFICLLFGGVSLWLLIHACN